MKKWKFTIMLQFIYKKRISPAIRMTNPFFSRDTRDTYFVYSIGFYTKKISPAIRMTNLFVPRDTRDNFTCVFLDIYLIRYDFYEKKISLTIRVTDLFLYHAIRMI